MKNHIKQTGIELEGLWYDKPDNFKEDGSVCFDDDNCNDECRDNCYCYEDCECTDCQRCNGCDIIQIRCQCDSCLICEDCSSLLDECSCDIISECKLTSCTTNDVCDNCLESFHELQNVGINCDIGSHGTYTECSIDCSCECSCECQCKQGGELSSEPLNKNEIEPFILNNYPDEQNFSCGAHVHISTINDKRDIFVLCTPEFYNHFINKIRLWAVNRNLNKGSRFFQRLDGQTYCKNEFKGYDQLKSGNSNQDRYTIINFCYFKYNTVEFRLAPMFNNKTILVEYVNELHNIVNNYLSKHEPQMYEFTLKINKTTSIFISMKMVKSGLRIFVKTFGIEDYVKTKDYSNYDKYNLYQNEYNRDSLQTNLTTLFDDDLNPNFTFLRLKGSSNGKSLIIKNVFSKKDIDNYMYSLISNLPRFINTIKGVIKICA